MSLELFLLLVCIAEAVGELVHALTNSGAFGEHGWKPRKGAATEFSCLGSTETLPRSNSSCGTHERKSVYTAWEM
jgi:hypothetical protein